MTQSFNDFELIVIDSGINESFKNTMLSLENIFLHRLKVVNVNSSNVFEMLNEGLRVANGKYVIFIESIAICEKTFVQTLYQNAEQTSADVVQHSTHGVIQNVEQSSGNFQFIIAKDEEIFIPNNDKQTTLDDWLNGKFSSRVYNKLIRRDFLVNNNINFSPDVYMPEWIFGLQLICLAQKYSSISELLYIHAKESDIEINNDVQNMIAGIEILEKFMSDLEIFNETPDLRREILKTYMKNFLK